MENKNKGGVTFTKSTAKFQQVDMGKYYRFRKALQELYDNDYINNYDLNGEILSLMEDNKLGILSISGSVESLSTCRTLRAAATTSMLPRPR